MTPKKVFLSKNENKKKHNIFELWDFSHLQLWVSSRLSSLQTSFWSIKTAASAGSGLFCTGDGKCVSEEDKNRQKIIDYKQGNPDIKTKATNTDFVLEQAAYVLI